LQVSCCLSLISCRVSLASSVACHLRLIINHLVLVIDLLYQALFSDYRYRYLPVRIFIQSAISDLVFVSNADL
jgi:hypothetical protein